MIFEEPSMTSYFNSNHHSSSNVSEGSSAPPSPASSIHYARSTASLSNAASPGAHSAHNVPRYGTLIPNRVFVGGISSSTTEADLQERFAFYGGIKEIKIIRDRAGICRGYGFITFDSDEAAKRAQNESEIIVLKERRLNIAPAFIKQPFNSFNRTYDLSQASAMMYHNGTSYAFDNGMAFFTNPGPNQSPYTAREVFSSHFAPTQGSATGHTYSPVMYPYTTQPVAYMPTSQQFSYQPMPFEAYFKAAAPASQYLYGPPASLNGSLNGPSQSSSPGYGQPPGPPGLPGPPGHSGPPVPPSAQYFHQASAELFYNGGGHLSHQPPTLYSLEGQQIDDYCDARERDSATPVVSLLKLQERAMEEMEITPRTPRKGSVMTSGGGGSTVTVSPYRSIYGPGSQMSQRPPRGRRLPMNVMGSMSAPPPSSGGRNPRGGSIQLRSVSSFPSAQSNSMGAGGGGGGGPGRNQYPHRRIVNASRSSTRSSGGMAPVNTRSPGPSVASPPPASVGHSSPSPTPPPAADANSVIVDETASGNARAVRHQLPLSPPQTPLPTVRATNTDDAEVCQQMQALAM